MLLAKVLAATLALVPAATAAITGTPCSTDKDKFACEGTAFLSCDSATRTWNLQNNCPVQCTDPASGYASFCYQNSLPGGAAGSSSPPGSTGQPNSPTGQNASATSAGGAAPTQTSATNQPGAQAGTSSGGGISTGAIIGISIGAVALAAVIFAAVFILIIRPRQSRSSEYGVPGASAAPRTFLSLARPNSKESTLPDVGTILEKKFVVTTDYEPSASDELRLRVGDSIVLDLLFNDGWAKGKNETTRQEGILPVACITQID